MHRNNLGWKYFEFSLNSHEGSKSTRQKNVKNGWCVYRGIKTWNSGNKGPAGNRRSREEGRSKKNPGKPYENETYDNFVRGKHFPCKLSGRHTSGQKRAFRAPLDTGSSVRDTKTANILYIIPDEEKNTKNVRINIQRRGKQTFDIKDQLFLTEIWKNL